MTMMGTERLAAAIAELSATAGLRGCAIVEAQTGMVWAAGGELADHISLWEAASDHWRLHRRNASHFEAIGPFGAYAAYHAQGNLVIFPCSTEPELLVVTVGRSRSVDWTLVKQKGLRLGRQIRGVD
jgi:hypothetical protein